MIRHVVWDWNGTLLDDVDHAVAALNTLLDARKMPRLEREHYRERFGFPVRDFYVGLGFDFVREDFAQVSESFIARYRIEATSAAPWAEARSVMTALHDAKVEQSVLSAMEHAMLHGMLAQHGLLPHLRHVRGLRDLHAHSKVALGVSLLRDLDAAPHEILFVGDTLHDYETAEAMGCLCALYSRGHQTEARLRGSGAQLISSLTEVVEIVTATQRV
jgi:phosphoglycolate phosphatase